LIEKTIQQINNSSTNQKKTGFGLFLTR